ncbi:efflux RND transporter periplasmic adaptor subunit [Microbulbifer bruguierae]|uniref:Efflux RND transporter periplasmic adaptor subunit n=1 Tax=Microbulbifer bruguierae TaxID=3029061 RepID=A0ABY8NIP4_9GAMM|nr:efflux RND transporter periplasmic adaptor subunit [Microbulbifer bruguierae]WGL18462.1 efflux RND transporter periplasmic adaptor subunit [Microbulbifer bruguierae]
MFLSMLSRKLRGQFPLATAILFLMLSGRVSGAGGHYGGHGNGRGEQKVVELGEQALARADLSTALAGPRKLEQYLTLYGKLLPEPTAVSHIRARYAGVVSQVKVHIGDKVEKGQVLATVDSNESLQEYQLRAPFAGMVTAKHAGPGEFVNDQILFTVADYSQLWADLQVFPARMASVRKGQRVQVSAGDRIFTGSVRSVVPGSENLPYARARVLVGNSDGIWAPGIFVEGRVEVATTEVPLAVDIRALQSLDGNTVVFVQRAPGRFEAVPVVLGARGKHFVEVRSGLKSGARYAVENSYLLKAELEKSSAEHTH